MNHSLRNALRYEQFSYSCEMLPLNQNFLGFASFGLALDKARGSRGRANTLEFFCQEFGRDAVLLESRNDGNGFVSSSDLDSHVDRL